MPDILAYHPQIAVKRGVEQFVIKADFPDWLPDREVLSTLGRAAGVKTAGQLVEALKSGRVRCQNSGCSNARIEKISASPVSSEIGWDEQI